MAKKQAATETEPQPPKEKPLFTAQCKFGGPSFGVDSVSIGVTFAVGNIPAHKREMFIKQQLRVRLSMDPNPSSQPMLDGMEDPYESATGIAECNKISIGDADVSTRLKFPKNAMDALFMVEIAGQTGSMSVLEIMGGNEGSEYDETDDDDSEVE